jgi:RES domain-containing protein
MLVYRIAKWPYLNDLSGQGARLFGGRWNAEGHAMLYTSHHLSLAVLEILANQIRQLVDDSYGYVVIEIPDDIPIDMYSLDDLPRLWRSNPYDQNTIQLGTQWLQKKESLILKVPSAVLHQESNILINPHHPDHHKIKIIETSMLQLDGRIAKTIQSP